MVTELQDIPDLQHSGLAGWRTMSRGTWCPRHVVAVLAVAILSSLSGCAAFHVVARSDQSAGRASGAAPAPRAQATPPSSTMTPLPARRVVAIGQQLWAGPPLKNVHQDQGSSVLLPDGRTLWIFADTFQLTRDPAFFVTSSAGLTDPGTWKLRYSVAPPVNGLRAPAEFLPRTAAEKADRTGDHYQAVWPTGSTVLPNGRILISYAKYRVRLKQNQYQYLGSGLYSFAYRSDQRFTSGDHAQRIADDIWTAADGEVRSPIYVDGHVYFTRCADLRCYSLRTTPAQLTQQRSYTWWTGSGWSTNANQRQQVRVTTNHPGGNPSIVRLKNGVYAMADTEAGVAAANGHFWVAPHPWGPWSRAATFRMPHCPAAGCYGLNLHPEASTGSVLRVSYATGGPKPIVRVDDVPVRIDAGGGWISVS